LEPGTRESGLGYESVNASYLLNLHKVILAALGSKIGSVLPRVACFAFELGFECFDCFNFVKCPLKLSTSVLTDSSPVRPDIKLAGFIVYGTNRIFPVSVCLRWAQVPTDRHLRFARCACGLLSMSPHEYANHKIVHNPVHNHEPA
jgi:hypothetical protein